MLKFIIVLLLCAAPGLQGIAHGSLEHHARESTGETSGDLLREHDRLTGQMLYLGPINDGRVSAAGFKEAAILEVNVSVKAFLQGPYAGGGTMNIQLNESGNIPTSQPYSVPPWNYPGNETVFQSFLDNNTTIVDWVLVELRSGTAANTVVGRRAGFIRQDGFVVDLDANSDLKFDGVIPEQYYVVVRHRNHLDIMTPNAVDFSTGSGGWDFTSGQGQAFGTNPMRDLGDGNFGMFGGDATASDRVGAGDNTVWLVDNGQEGYYQADFTLSSRVGAADNAMWIGNNGQASAVPE